MIAFFPMPSSSSIGHHGGEPLWIEIILISVVAGCGIALAVMIYFMIKEEIQEKKKNNSE